MNYEFKDYRNKEPYEPPKWLDWQPDNPLKYLLLIVFFNFPIYDPIFFKAIGNSFGPNTSIAIMITDNISNQPIWGILIIFFQRQSLQT